MPEHPGGALSRGAGCPTILWARPSVSFVTSPIFLLSSLSVACNWSGATGSVPAIRSRLLALTLNKTSFYELAAWAPVLAWKR